VFQVAVPPCPPTDKQAADLLATYAPASVSRDKLDRITAFGTAPEAAQEEANNIARRVSADAKDKIRKRLAQPINPKHCRGQPTSIKVSFISNPTYETNTLKTASNSGHDISSDLGGSVLLTTGLGETRPYDLNLLQRAIGVPALCDVHLQSLDTLNAQAAYQYLIDAYFYNERSQAVPLDPKHIPPINAVTYDTASFGVLNRTVHSNLSDPVGRSVHAADHARAPEGFRRSPREM
jgi:hypothetical protein